MPISTTSVVFGKKATANTLQKVADTVDVNRTGIALSFSDGSFLSKATKLELLRSQITQLLLTEPGERVMLPEFGVSLYSYVFEELDKTTVEEIQERIVNAITKFVPNAVILDISVNSYENTIGSMTINISLTVKSVDLDSVITITVEK